MKKRETYTPTLEELETALLSERYESRFRKAFRSAIYALSMIAAITVLAATLFVPVLRIYGKSMTPTLYDGDIVVSLKTGEFHRGDVIAFYYNNKVLVKRVIALSGEWVDIDENGDVYINDVYQPEDYLQDGAKAFGTCDLELPYQVPEGYVFVMGDHREVSADSRVSSIGCVSQEQLIGRLVFRVYPFKRIGFLKKNKLKTERRSME